MPATPRRRRLLAAAAVLALSGALAACGGSAGSKGPSASVQQGVLTVATGANTFTANFNPFSPNQMQATDGLIYEPLFFYNTMKAGDVHPWLGTSFSWADGGTTLHIKIRSGVKWSDGQPLTPDDVAFSFQNAIDSQALNAYGLPLSSVATEGGDGVVLKFSQPAYTKEYFVLGKTLILPRHVWSAIPVDQRTTTLNSKPVGTGAWTVKSVATSVLTLAARKDYYFAGYPKFKEIRYLGFNGNNSIDAAISSGKTDWSGGFIPDIQKNYLAKDPKFTLVNIPLAVTFFVPNAAQGPTADPNVRKAISAAVDRDFMSRSVYDGQAPATNPSALLLPNYSSIQDSSVPTSFETGQEKVDAYLRASGYTRGSDGYWAKDGKRLSITVKTVSGWTDYLSIDQLAQQQLKKAGIELKVTAEAYNTWAADQASGNFEMLLSNYGYTPDPRAYYAQMLDSRIAKPIGQQTTGGNYGRYKSAVVDEALDRIGATTDVNQQKTWFAKIQQQFVKDMPLIPLMDAQNEAEFNGNNVKGFPTADNPYAAPSVWLFPDAGWVAMRLEPVTAK
ncbi:ABC transporter substrate-binding protein [Streptacidiphilus monticola]|uniref:ABC transporter substrate-binding protein n=1 Tax=Streptacidiphilus monticola TaxID=2161674 RepID=A0ABW1G0Z7_9ACTN